MKCGRERAWLVAVALLWTASATSVWAQQLQGHTKSLRSQHESTGYVTNGAAGRDDFYTSGGGGGGGADDYASPQRGGARQRFATSDAATHAARQEQQQQGSGAPLHDANGNRIVLPRAVAQGPGASSGNPVSSPAGGQTGAERRAAKVPVLTILTMTTIMALMSGLGAVPFFFVSKLSNAWAGLANAVACGVMLAASFDLLHEGAPYSPTLTIFGMVVGAMFIRASQEYLDQFEDASFEELSGADARKAMLIVGVMAAHAFGEGSGVGVSFSGNRGWAQGMLVTIAIGLHNVPEGMAVATVMVAKGTPPKKALFWSLFCAFPQALVALPSYLFVETFQPLLPVALGFAAGCMVWIVSAELMPDALKAAPHPAVATATTLSAAWLQGLSMAIATLERPDGQLDSPVKAVPSALAHVAFCMLPALCTLPAAAAAAAPALPSLPAALGAAAGVLGTLGALGTLRQVLAAGTATLGAGSALMWAGVGAGSAVLLWRNVIMPPGGGVGGGGLEVRRSLDDQFASAQGDGYDAKWHAPVAQHEDHTLVVQHSGNSMLLGHANSFEAGGVHMRSTAAVHGQGFSGKQGGGGGGGNGQGYQHHPPPPPSAFLAYSDGTAGSGGGMVHISLDEHGSSPGRTGGYGGGTGHYAAGNGQQQHDAHSGILSSTAEVVVAVSAALHHRPSGGLGSGALSAGASRLARVGLLAVLLVLLQAAAALGERVAVAVAAQWAGDGGGADAHWMLPLALQGLPLGLASVGASRALAGSSGGGGGGGTGPRPGTWVATAAVGTAVLTALSCLAGTPLGQHDAAAVASLADEYDAQGWARAARAAAGGALAAASALYLWPAAVASKAARARAGAVVGAAAALLCEALATVLCLGTPYCLPA